MNKYTYLDNAATTFPKPRYVIKEVVKCLKGYCGNPGRGTHTISLKAAEKVFDTREKIANYIGLSNPERIIFSQNATHALNMAIKGKLNHKCHIITSDFEHNSVLRPLYKQMQKNGIEISYYDTDLPIYDAILPLIRSDTEFLITSIASNVTGKTIDVNALSDIATRYNLFTILDVSQYLGHLSLDLRKTPFDIICAPGHKSLFGIQGSGFMALNTDEDFETLIEGGSGSESFNPNMPRNLPERFEAGTVNTPAIVSLGAGISYISALGEKYIMEKLDALTHRLYEILSDTNAIIYGCENGIAAFDIKGKLAREVVEHLDERNIATRGGLHCAPLIHRKLGTEKYGTVRVSLSILNSLEDLDRLYIALKGLGNLGAT